MPGGILEVVRASVDSPSTCKEIVNEIRAMMAVRWPRRTTPFKNTGSVSKLLILVSPEERKREGLLPSF